MQFLDPSRWNRPPETSTDTRLSAAEDLALDEGLLRRVEGAPPPCETLRVWQASGTVVIAGRSSRLADEVNLAACQELNVPVLRRCSGGCAVVAGPGCLMYSVVLDLRHRPELRVIDQAHEFVLQKTLQALKACQITNARQAGLSDLVVESDGSQLKKFSGNSLRITRDALLYHGTILYEFPLNLITELLLPPPREPVYRGQREHSRFVTNLTIQPNEFISRLKKVWNARTTIEVLCSETDIQELMTSKYAHDHWNRRH